MSAASRLARRASQQVVDRAAYQLGELVLRNLDEEVDQPAEPRTSSTPSARCATTMSVASLAPFGCLLGPCTIVDAVVRGHIELLRGHCADGLCLSQAISVLTGLSSRSLDLR